MASGDFGRKSKLPVQGMPLNDTEECLAVRAKKRPCVLLAKNLTLSVPSNMGTTQKKTSHLLQDAALFLPLYGVEDANHVGGFPQPMVDRIKILMYEQFFFFKKGMVQGSTRDFLIEDSVGRFDRIFVSTLHHPAVSPLDGKLTSDVMNVVSASLARYFKLPLEAQQAETFTALLSLIQESLPTK
jgi:hypothetical protein